MAGSSALDSHLLALVKSYEWAHPEGGKQERGFWQLKLHCFAKVTSAGASEDEQQRLRRVGGRLGKGATWHLTPLASLSPQLREFQALCSLGSLRPEVLSALLDPAKALKSRPSAPRHAAWPVPQLPGPMVSALQRTFNRAQLDAIAMVADPSLGPFALVQGPPGTGKTATILGIAAVLRHRAAAARQAEGDAEQTGRRSGRLLICTQSNAAADEIVARLVARGLMDGEGREQKANIVRFGRLEAVSEAVRPYHIDSLAERYTSRCGRGCHCAA